ncbi:MAG: NAD(P)-dependent oxidoreductase [Thermoanaerobaculales bacterium]|jgi:nucleoside-diphosphate-sugar epimerase|nr:NAD(P)-dependent oxidoreductase [Thermoanaerobaculales bacterium]
MTEDFSPSNPLITPDDVRPFIDATAQPIALTGGTGFVGSHVVDTLCAAGLRPRVMVRDPEQPRWIAGVDADLVAGSLEDVVSLDRLVEGAGTVIHLAGVLRAAREADFDRGNREGTAKLVDAVRRTAPEAGFIHVSSLAAVGPSPDPEGLGPDDPPAPVSAYGRSKLAGEREVESLGNERRWCILRPPAVYGPRDTDILEFFKMAARGLAAIPAGERWLTLAYVGDVVRAVAAAAAVGERGRIYHLGEPEPRPLDLVFRDVAATGGCRVRVVAVPPAVIRAAGAAGSALQRLGMQRMPLTSDKATELLAKHWTAVTSESLEALGVGAGTGFSDGAAATWRWYRLLGWVR